MKTQCAQRNNRQLAKGFTLIEVMVALLIFAVLAIGSVSMMIRSGETVTFQRDKRAAIAAASRRMEQVRTIPYTQFEETRNNIAVGSSPVFLSYNGTSFSRSGSNPNEQVAINGLQRPIQTQVRFVNTAAGSYTQAQCLEIVVRLSYRPGVNDDIVLTSLYSN